MNAKKWSTSFYWVLRIFLAVSAALIFVAALYPAKVVQGPPPGKTGAQGIEGPAGADGVGKKGEPGDRGRAGSDGSKGKQGETGATGAKGSGFWSGK